MVLDPIPKNKAKAGKLSKATTTYKLIQKPCDLFSLSYLLWFQMPLSSFKNTTEIRHQNCGFLCKNSDKT